VHLIGGEEFIKKKGTAKGVGRTSEEGKTARAKQLTTGGEGLRFLRGRPNGDPGLKNWWMGTL